MATRSSSGQSQTEEAPDDVAVILVAAGGSSRMQGTDKLWADVAGDPLIAHSLRILAAIEGVRTLAVVAPSERHDDIRALLGECPLELRCVEGGARRQDSVAAGIAAAPDAAWYLVHDAARPLVTLDLARRVLDAARAAGAAVPAVPLVDTVKRVDGAGRVVETLDRSALRAVQTPQAFAGALLRRAHAEVREDVTDDAAMLERLGLPVVTVEGDPRNLKVTTPVDLELARPLLLPLSTYVERGQGGEVRP